MAYRTKTYIAGDWTGDKSAIDQLHKWNDSKFWGLTFNDAHDITQANDGSLNCSINRHWQQEWISRRHSFLSWGMIQRHDEPENATTVRIIAMVNVVKGIVLATKAILNTSVTRLFAMT